LQPGQIIQTLDSPGHLTKQSHDHPSVQKKRHADPSPRPPPNQSDVLEEHAVPSSTGPADSMKNSLFNPPLANRRLAARPLVKSKASLCKTSGGGSDGDLSPQTPEGVSVTPEGVTDHPGPGCVTTKRSGRRPVKDAKLNHPEPVDQVSASSCVKPSTQRQRGESKKLSVGVPPSRRYLLTHAKSESDSDCFESLSDRVSSAGSERSSSVRSVTRVKNGPTVSSTNKSKVSRMDVGGKQHQPVSLRTPVASSSSSTSCTVAGGDQRLENCYL